jgi:hypothetical protein
VPLSHRQAEEKQLTGAGEVGRLTKDTQAFLDAQPDKFCVSRPRGCRREATFLPPIPLLTRLRLKLSRAASVANPAYGATNSVPGPRSSQNQFRPGHSTYHQVRRMEAFKCFAQAGVFLIIPIGVTHFGSGAKVPGGAACPVNFCSQFKRRNLASVHFAHTLAFRHKASRRRARLPRFVYNPCTTEDKTLECAP